MKRIITTLPTLEELKSHLRVDYDDDNDYILSLGDAAEDAVSVYLGYSAASHIATGAPGSHSIRQAIMLLVGTWYENRASVTFGTAQEIPHGVAALLVRLRRQRTCRRDC